MELNGIVQSLEHKSILVTGSTGFLSKIFVEKLLRVQPNVKQLFLLLRAPDTPSATQRLQNDVTGKEVFRVLRKKYGVGFDSFISEKVTPIAGDIALENFGMKDSDLKKKILKEVNIVANFAATTNFNERYDVALDVNTMGPQHVLDFAEKCENLEMLLHISTAYVCRESSGVILEEPLKLGGTLSETSSESLDIEGEINLANQTLNQLKAKNVSMNEETNAMKNLGRERAKFFGWPNTYTFTKAMGEMVIGRFRRTKFPIIIMRPTIVTSTYREPFPGWIEGIKTIDPFIVSFGKGKIPCFLGNLEAILDLIPGDMVVNASIAAMVAHLNNTYRSSADDGDGDDSDGGGQFPIYHVGSSTRSDPMDIMKVVDYAFHYFSNKNPWKGKDGKPISLVKPVFFPTRASFEQHVHTNYTLPMKEREIIWAKQLIELYEPYIFFKRIFDDSNLEKLRTKIRVNKAELDTFCFESKCIDWEDYFMNVHMPGLMKYVIKSEDA